MVSIQQNKPNINITLKDQIVVYRDSTLEPQNKNVEYIENGDYLVEPDEGYRLETVGVKVNVPIPEGYVKPEGTLDIIKNNEYDVTTYKKVNVNVPSGIFPEGELEITTNGAYDVTDYATASVNVPNLWNKYMNNKGTNWCYLFSGNSNATSVDEYLAGRDSSQVIRMDYMFNGCSSLLSIPQLNTSNVTNISNMFYGCESLETIPQLDISKVTTTSHMFNACKKLVSIPPLNTIKSADMTSMFYYCHNLKTIDLTSMDLINATYKSSSMCSNCYSLTKLIVRTMTKVPTINTNTFDKCYHILGKYDPEYNVRVKKDGYIYVPDDWVEQVKAASNWSTIATQIKGLSELDNEEPEAPETQPYLLTIKRRAAGSSTFNQITEDGEYYGTAYTNNVKVWFRVPEEATNRTLKIKHRKDLTSSKCTVRSCVIDQDSSAETIYYTFEGVEPLNGEIIYENLPTGDHFIELYDYHSNGSLYFTFDFVE